LTSIPESIGALKELELLDLSSNKLTDIPKNMASYPKLWKLNLDGN